MFSNQFLMLLWEVASDDRYGIGGCFTNRHSSIIKLRASSQRSWLHQRTFHRGLKIHFPVAPTHFYTAGLIIRCSASFLGDRTACCTVRLSVEPCSWRCCPLRGFSIRSSLFNIDSLLGARRVVPSVRCATAQLPPKKTQTPKTIILPFLPQE